MNQKQQEAGSEATIPSHHSAESESAQAVEPLLETSTPSVKSLSYRVLSFLNIALIF